MVSNRKQPIVRGAFFLLLGFLQACRSSVRGLKNQQIDRSCHRSFGHLAKRVFALLVIAFSIGSADARTWHVKADQTGDAPTIQAAIDSSTAGDSILIDVGIYDENLNTSLKELFLIGVAGAAATIVDGGLRARVLTFSGGGCVEGLTLRRGRDTNGGGMQVSGPAPALVRNNIIEENVAGLGFDQGLGGGIWLDSFTDGAVLVESNVIRNNTAGDKGGGLYDGGGTPPNIVRDNLVVGNGCLNNGGGMAISSADVVGNVIVDNSSENGAAGLQVFGIPNQTEIVNNTIMGNRSANSANVHGAGLMSSCAPRISHNIIAFNTAPLNKGAGIWLNSSLLGAAGPIECNDIWGNDIDEIINSHLCSQFIQDNISADPEFCAIDPVSSLSFVLQQDSPCAPGNHRSGSAQCGQIGAAPVGCTSVSIQERTWSGLKRLYR